jgi:S1-C subfamily serine protease
MQRMPDIRDLKGELMSAIAEFSKGLTEAAEKGGAGTVLVDARQRFPASGIVYAADLVLTADHVVTREDSVKITAPDGKTTSAHIAGRDPGSDLVLLRLDASVLSPAKVASSPAKVGQLVLAVARPTADGIQASWGIVTNIGGQTRTGRGGFLDAYIQSETTPYPGFSGGPLVNTEGEILGLNTSGLTHGGALTIPSTVAWRTAAALAKYGSVRRGYLGVKTQSVELPEAGRAGLKSGQARGLLVMWLEQDGPAAKAGVLIGDILVGIGSGALSDPDDLFAALTGETVGTSVTFEILRGGKLQSVSINVGERK